jgi:hypothetical protein
VVSGFPEVHYETYVEGSTIHHKIRHMAYYFGLGPDDVFENDGWDYIENHCSHGESSKLPKSFSGMSGGPVWSVKWGIDETNGQWSLTTFALVGIIFYETVISSDELRLRSHFIKSIYDLAWRGM